MFEILHTIINKFVKYPNMPWPFIEKVEPINQ